MTLERRLVARKLNIRKRFVALSSQELKMSEKLQKLVLLCMVKARSADSEEMEEKYNWLAKESLRRYCNIVYYVDGQLPRPIRLDKRIASFTLLWRQHLPTFLTHAQLLASRRSWSLR